MDPPEPLPAVYLARDFDRGLPASMVRQGLWVVVRPGALCEAPTGPAWRRRRHLALAHAIAVARQNPDAVLSGLSSALVQRRQVWRLPQQTTVIQTVTPRSGMSREIRRSIAALPETDVVEVDGVRVTSLPRTALDCARSLHPREALVVVDSCLRALVDPRRGEDPGDVEARAALFRAEMLDRIEPRSRGAIQGRAVLTWSDPLAEMAPESSIRWVVVSRGMPRPVLQREVDTARGRKYTDLAWLKVDGTWMHVEFDGFGKYEEDSRGRSTAQVLVDERRREAAITDVGDKVIRIYPDEIPDDDLVFRKITASIPQTSVAAWRPVRGLYRPLGY